MSSLCIDNSYYTFADKIIEDLQEYITNFCARENIDIDKIKEISVSNKIIKNININIQSLICLRIVNCSTDIFDLEESKIKRIVFDNCKLNKLQIKSNYLKELSITTSDIQEITDLYLPQLLSIFIYGNNINIISNLNMPKLKKCNIANCNKLTEIVNLNFPKLTILSFDSLPVKNICINFKKLKELYICKTAVEQLDFYYDESSDSCNRNEYPSLRIINVRKNKKLKIFNNKKINFPLLRKLNCSENDLDELADITTPLLRILNISGNRISQLISPELIPEIYNINAANNQLSVIYKYPSLYKLKCQNNNLEEIEIGDNLRKLLIADNPKLQLTSVNKINILFMSRGQLDPNITYDELKNVHLIKIINSDIPRYKYIEHGIYECTDVDDIHDIFDGNCDDSDISDDNSTDDQD